MGNAFQKIITQVAGSSKLHLSPTTTSRLPRDLPLGFAISVWLRKSILIGAIFVAIATIIYAIAIPKGSLPTFVVLWIDHQTAKGVVDSVQHRTVTKSKGMKVAQWDIRLSWFSGKWNLLSWFSVKVKRILL